MVWVFLYFLHFLPIWRRWVLARAFKNYYVELVIAWFNWCQSLGLKNSSNQIVRGRGTGEASEATASPEFRGFITENFLTFWIYKEGSYSCFTGKKLVPRLLSMYTYFYVRALIMIGYFKLAKNWISDTYFAKLKTFLHSWKCVRR